MPEDHRDHPWRRTPHPHLREADRPHDFETESRQRESATGSCATCGLARSAAIHH